MDDQTEGFALYWVPPRGEPLARYGRALTGWCPEDGMTEDAPARQGAVGGLARHGLHAALGPAVPAGGHGCLRRMERLARTLAAATGPVLLPMLRPAIVGGRLSLLPAGPVPALDRLVRAARAGLGELGAAAGELPPFHLPLFDPLPELTAHRLLGVLRAQMQGAPGMVPFAPVWIGDIALMQDPGLGRPLRVLRRYALGEPAQGRNAPAARGASAVAPFPPHGEAAFAPPA